MATKKNKKPLEPKVIRKLADLAPDPLNARKHNERNIGMLERSLKEVGAARSIVVDENGRILAGHGVVEAAANVGIEKVRTIEADGDEIIAVVRRGLTKEQKQSLALYDNRVGELSEWNPEMLRTLQEQGAKLDGLWTDKELAALNLQSGEIEEGPEPQIDKAAELQREWGTKRGQMWDIGKHRLMCGDACEQLEVAQLFRQRKAWLLASDPPYGVAFGVESGPDSARRFAPLQNDDKDGPQLQTFLENAFRAALVFLEPGACWYLWHAQMTQGFFAAAAAAAAGLLIHRQIIWAKSHFILGHGDFHWQHELCFYGWRKGETHRWFGGRDQSTLWQIQNARVHENHPTEKPPELFARSIRLSTKRGEICYEPFAGSGTQFVAAEQLGRICYGMEIEPKYVAVSIQRMADMGLKPQLVKK
jgi:site-specific DNA-methyltransferase (adenine-specific)